MWEIRTLRSVETRRCVTASGNPVGLDTDSRLGY
jgi:hypothetical protein